MNRRSRSGVHPGGKGQHYSPAAVLLDKHIPAAAWRLARPCLDLLHLVAVVVVAVVDLLLLQQRLARDRTWEARSGRPTLVAAARTWAPVAARRTAASRAAVGMESIADATGRLGSRPLSKDLWEQSRQNGCALAARGWTDLLFAPCCCSCYWLLNDVLRADARFAEDKTRATRRLYMVAVATEVVDLAVVVVVAAAAASTLDSFRVELTVGRDKSLMSFLKMSSSTEKPQQSSNNLRRDAVRT